MSLVGLGWHARCVSVWSWFGDHGIEVLAFGAAAVAVGYSRRATRIAHESADYTRRATEVTERAEQRAIADAARTAVRWELEPNPTYVAETHGLKLTNVGTHTAHDFHVDLPPNAQTVGTHPVGVAMQPGLPLTLEVALFGARDPHVTLRWRAAPDGEVQLRTYPFPM